MGEKGSSGNFRTTRWTIVQRSKGECEEARVALGDLCEAYWEPVFLFLRSSGRNDDESRELAQSFFEKVLSAGGGFGGADQERGKFRSYLLGALKNFLSERRRYETREKRGSGAYHASIETGGFDGMAMEIGDDAADLAGIYFDQQWAQTVLVRATKMMQREYEEKGKGKQLEVLMPWLSSGRVEKAQSEAARELGLRVGAVKVLIHRMRQRLGELIRGEVAQTVNDGADIDEEVRYLIEVIGSGK